MKKNVLVFSSTFPRWQSDPVTARFVLDLAMELTEHFNVFVLTPHAPKTQRYEEWDGLKIIRFPYFYPLNSQALVDGTGMLSCLRNRWLAKLQVPLFLACQALALQKTVKKYKIDVVNSHWMIPQGFIAATLKKYLGFKHILTIHAADLFALRRFWLGRQIARAIVNNTDTIYCVSSYNHLMLNDLIKSQIPARILPMGIDTRYYADGMDQETARKKLGLGSGKMILYVGKLSEKKGVGYLIKAFGLVADEARDAFLVIVGGGLLEKSLKEETNNLGLTNKIFFAGYQTKENIRTYYNACDLVAIPSIIDSAGETEGLPVVLLEALASGKPVVGTRVGGISDIIVEGENGFLAEQKNAEDMAGKIKLFFNSDSNRSSRNALKSARKYDWETIGREYHKNIVSLLN